ncbi:FAD:protein FMN transferase [Taibaiella chishuiensis]|uniref:FAD:protein FMN transferase n=1 Tax=Taibaiella chishuiensis TaxID=1434707 RepID=A0A2P8D4Q7_9BACT|nr:FAD:protein FMN transferase [Taibaiella chishuiensis]PSK92197.1 thiamine biosynthesis lipoprotein [Taibaiella chishuiensis]
MLQKCNLRKRMMGSDFELIACCDSEAAAAPYLQAGVAEITRLERLLTEFDEDSQTSLINRNAGIAPVTVDGEVYRLIQRCIRLSELSQGAFDITAGTLKSLYRFNTGNQALPGKHALKEQLRITGFRNIELGSDNQVLLRKKGMRIGFGAIGKGYAADRVKALWTASGLASGVINASGDLTAWGCQPDGSPWRIGIADPGKEDTILRWIPVEKASVATSGNYIQYFEHKGIRYSHNIDPRTGLPARLLKSVTIVSPGAELSDALATAVTIMGADAGLYLLGQLPGVHGIIVDEHNHVLTSEKISTHASI